MVISGFQLCAVMRKAAGLPASFPSHDDPSALLVAICDEGMMKLPFDPENVFWMRDRIPVFNDLQKPLDKSTLLSQLSMRSEDTGLVVDSLRRGGDAVYFAKLTSSWVTVDDWMQRAQQSNVHITVKSAIDEHVLILATFKTFVVPQVAG